MWRRFAVIGRGSSEITRWKKKKHHEHFISPPVTTYGRPNKCPLQKILCDKNTQTYYTTISFWEYVDKLYHCIIVSRRWRRFSEDFSFTFWLPGWVVGPEVGPKRKWQGLGPTLSIAGAATKFIQGKNGKKFKRDLKQDPTVWYK